MIKLRKTLFFLILVNTALYAYSNIYIINTDKLPDNGAFNQNMRTLLSFNQYINHWTNEWNYPVDKSVIITFLKAFHNGIVSINTINDYELNLLDVVIMTYLYNLNETNYFNDISVTVEKMKNDFPDEYRTYWISGNFLISAARPMNGFDEFKSIFAVFDYNMDFFPVEFLDDYAYACIMNQMLRSGMEHTHDRNKQ